MRRLLAGLTVLVAALGAAAPAGARETRHSPAGAAFYHPPRLAAGHGHGGVIWSRRDRSGIALPHARNELVLYRSIGVRGTPVAVSGTVAVPRGKAPKGGWPVVTWAHGTSGVGNACAPTKVKAVKGAVPYDRSLDESWIKAGYAVVRTDYEGLGTPGIHPYLIGRSEGRSTLDIVRAARRLISGVGRRVVISGHSQGGQAALWAAALAPRWTPELRVRGTVPFAPANHLGEQAKAFPALTTPGGGLSALVSLMIRGADTAYPDLHLGRSLSDRARQLYPQTNRRCLGGLAAGNSFGGLGVAQLLKPGADWGPLQESLSRNDPEDLRIHTPVHVEQGQADSTVFPGLTASLVEELRGRGTRIGEKTWPRADHVGVIAAAGADATRWIRSRLGG
jgi:pimeloyl-ACP methyl ester carboxylesterase